MFRKTVILLVLIKMVRTELNSSSLTDLVAHDQQTSTCNLNDKYWELIEWFFGRITYVEVTELVETRTINSHFANFLIKQLAHSKFVRHYSQNEIKLTPSPF